MARTGNNNLTSSESESAESELSYMVYCKGSAERVQMGCREESVPKDLSAVVNRYARNGYYCIAVAQKEVRLLDRSCAIKDPSESNSKPLEGTTVAQVLPNQDLNSFDKNLLSTVSMDQIGTLRCYTQVETLGRAFCRNERQQLLDNLPSRDECETDLEFIGLLLLRNEMKPESPGVIRELNNGDVRSVMITGDSIYTGVAIARECEMIDARKTCWIGDVKERSGQVTWEDFDKEESADNQLSTQDLCKKIKLSGPEASELAITEKAYRMLMGVPLTSDSESSTFDFSDYHLFSTVLFPNISVFGRMKPLGKKFAIRQLQRDSNAIVGMVGDGGNDSGALKAAHIGIALTASDNAIVAPFTSKDKDIRSVIHLLLEGRCCLDVSVAVFLWYTVYGVVWVAAAKVFMQMRRSFAPMAAWVYLDTCINIIIPYALSTCRPTSFLTRESPDCNLLGTGFFRKFSLSIVIQLAVLCVLFGVCYSASESRGLWYNPVSYMRDGIESGGDISARSHNFDTVLLYVNQVIFFVIFALVLAKPLSGNEFRSGLFLKEGNSGRKSNKVSNLNVTLVSRTEDLTENEADDSVTLQKKLGNPDCDASKIIPSKRQNRFQNIRSTIWLLFLLIGPVFPILPPFFWRTPNAYNCLWHINCDNETWSSMWGDQNMYTAPGMSMIQLADDLETYKKKSEQGLSLSKGEVLEFSEETYFHEDEDLTKAINRGKSYVQQYIEGSKIYGKTLSEGNSIKVHAVTAGTSRFEKSCAIEIPITQAMTETIFQEHKKYYESQKSNEFLSELPVTSSGTDIQNNLDINLSYKSLSPLQFCRYLCKRSWSQSLSEQEQDFSFNTVLGANYAVFDSKSSSDGSSDGICTLLNIPLGVNQDRKNAFVSVGDDSVRDKRMVTIHTKSKEDADEAQNLCNTKPALLSSTEIKQSQYKINRANVFGLVEDMEQNEIGIRHRIQYGFYIAYATTYCICGGLLSLIL